MARLAASERTLLPDLEKFRYLQVKRYGGQAERKCISLAPAEKTRDTMSLSCVPRTIESSVNKTRF